MPTGLPLRGKEGRDADGYPTQYVDRPALRSLLSHGKYEELTRYFEAYQAAFEEDPRHEYWPLDAAQAFDDLGARVLVPVAHGSFPLSYEPLDAPAEWLRRIARDRRLPVGAPTTPDARHVALLGHGETVHFRRR